MPEREIYRDAGGCPSIGRWNWCGCRRSLWVALVMSEKRNTPREGGCELKMESRPEVRATLLGHCSVRNDSNES